MPSHRCCGQCGCTAAVERRKDRGACWAVLLYARRIVIVIGEFYCLQYNMTEYFTNIMILLMIIISPGPAR